MCQVKKDLHWPPTLPLAWAGLLLLLLKSANHFVFCLNPQMLTSHQVLYWYLRSTALIHQL